MKNGSMPCGQLEFSDYQLTRPPAPDSIRRAGQYMELESRTGYGEPETVHPDGDPPTIRHGPPRESLPIVTRERLVRVSPCATSMSARLLLDLPTEHRVGAERRGAHATNVHPRRSNDLRRSRCDRLYGGWAAEAAVSEAPWPRVGRCIRAPRYFGQHARSNPDVKDWDTGPAQWLR